MTHEIILAMLPKYNRQDFHCIELLLHFNHLKSKMDTVFENLKSQTFNFWKYHSFLTDFLDNFEILMLIKNQEIIGTLR